MSGVKPRARRRANRKRAKNGKFVKSKKGRSRRS